MSREAYVEPEEELSYCELRTLLRGCGGRYAGARTGRHIPRIAGCLSGLHK